MGHSEDFLDEVFLEQNKKSADSKHKTKLVGGIKKRDRSCRKTLPHSHKMQMCDRGNEVIIMGRRRRKQLLQNFITETKIM